MTDYDKLRELAEKATPGPWYVHDPDGYGDVQAERDRGRPLMLNGVCENAGSDAEYIAAANPQMILNLLEDLRITRAERDGEKKKLMQMSKDHTAEILAWDALAEDGRVKAWDEGYEVGCNDGWHDNYKGTTNPYRKDTK